MDIQSLERGFVLASQDEYAPEAPGNEECLRAYLDWLETDGTTLEAKWLAGEPFAPAELEPLWLVKAGCIWRGNRAESRRRQGLELSAGDARFADYVQQLEQRGREVMIKGYFGEHLSAGDLDTIREYRILAEVRILRTPVWPYELGIHEPGGPRAYPTLGEELPDFCWPRLETVLQSPKCSDGGRRDPRAIMRPDSVEDFLGLFEGYEAAEDATGRKYVRPRLPAYPAEQNPDQYIRLRSFRGIKPVALLVASATDCFWPRAAEYLQSLQEAYGGGIEFLFVNIRLWDFLIYSSTTQNYFEPNVGIELPPFARTLGQRAHAARAFYMTYPQHTLPCVLDDPCDTTACFFQADGGSATAVLIDIDGRLAWQSTHYWGVWNRLRPPKRRASEGFPWANVLEREIRQLLARGGSYDSDHAPFNALDGQAHKPTAAEGTELWLSASRITGIDSHARTVTIFARPVARFTVRDKQVDEDDFFNPRQELLVQVDDGTRIDLGNAPVEFETMRIGDVVTGPIWKRPDGAWVAKSLHLSIRDSAPSEPPEPKFAGEIFLCGRIIEVNPDERTCIVERPRPDVARMKGYPFNRGLQSGASVAKTGQAERIELYGLARANQQAVERWIADGSRRYTFGLDDDTLVTLNGRSADMAELCPGDVVGVRYDPGEEDSERLCAAYFRASRGDGE